MSKKKPQPYRSPSLAYVLCLRLTDADHDKVVAFAKRHGIKVGDAGRQLVRLGLIAEADGAEHFRKTGARR